MIERRGDTLNLSGAVTLATASSLARDCCVQAAGGARVLDWTGVTEVDSSALALILETMRRGHARLRVTGLPDSMKGLLALYGLENLIDPQ